MQLYDITIAANTTRQLDAPGSYFYYYAGSAGGADSTITLRGISSGLRLILKPGQAFRLPKGDVETSWILTNYANTATIVGTVLVGDGDITDNRVTGSVEVVDGGKNRTSSGSAHIATFNVGPFASAWSVGMLWNPTNSGKNIFVKTLSFSHSVTASYGAQLATALGTGLTQTNMIAPKRNGATSVAQTYVSNSTYAVQWTAPYGSYATANLAANNIDKTVFQEPILLQPGSGLVVFSTVNNIQQLFTEEFFEESI